MISRWFPKNPTPVLRGDGLVLRAPQKKDFEQWQALRADSHKFLKPFEPTWSVSELTRDVFYLRLRRSARLARQSGEFTFLIFDTSEGDERLAGGITLSNVRLRFSMHANLGYWMGAPYAGRGIMSRAVALVLKFAFYELKLQRVHAACLPRNAASRRVLEKNGFREEGFADHYLKIDGRWQDHVLFGLSRERYLEHLYGV